MVRSMSTRERCSRLATRRWERVSKLLPERYVRYPLKGGWVYLSLANSPTQVQRLLRVYEPAKFANIERFLPPGGGFVDVGANAGDFTVWAAKVGGPATRVLAVEAEPGNATWLRRTATRNRLDDRVTVVAAAASDVEGEVELLITAKNGTHSIVESELHKVQAVFRPLRRVTIPAHPLDDLIARSVLERVDLVKIDVEGAELLVLRGAPQLLGGSKPLTLLIDLHFGVDVGELAALLQGYGFTLSLEGEPDVPITEIPPHTLSIVARRGV
jgi:FkbM family methyltransferase